MVCSFSMLVLRQLLGPCGWGKWLTEPMVQVCTSVCVKLFCFSSSLSFSPTTVCSGLL